MKFIFSFLMLGLSVSQAFAQSAPASTPPKYKTALGTEFNIVIGPDVPPSMRGMYRDPMGLLWGDMQYDISVFGKEVRVAIWQPSLQNAADFCATISYRGHVARLPTVEEWIRLRDDMSLTPSTDALNDLLATGVTINPTYVVDQPALPNLYSCGMVKVVEGDLTCSGGWSYWAAGTSQTRKGDQYIFSSMDGRLSRANHIIATGARCVIDP